MPVGARWPTAIGSGQAAASMALRWQSVTRHRRFDPLDMIDEGGLERWLKPAGDDVTFSDREGGTWASGEPRAGVVGQHTTKR